MSPTTHGQWPHCKAAQGSASLPEPQHKTMSWGKWPKLRKDVVLRSPLWNITDLKQVEDVRDQKTVQLVNLERTEQLTKWNLYLGLWHSFVVPIIMPQDLKQKHIYKRPFRKTNDSSYKITLVRVPRTNNGYKIYNKKFRKENKTMGDCLSPFYFVDLSPCSCATASQYVSTNSNKWLRYNFQQTATGLKSSTEKLWLSHRRNGY